jgi:hypothetical protein
MKPAIKHALGDQTEFIDDVVITTDRPANKDAQGNCMIGPTDWAPKGAGKATLPAAPASAPAPAAAIPTGSGR